VIIKEHPFISHLISAANQSILTQSQDFGDYIAIERRDKIFGIADVQEQSLFVAIHHLESEMIRMQCSVRKCIQHILQCWTVSRLRRRVEGTRIGIAWALSLLVLDVVEQPHWFIGHLGKFEAYQVVRLGTGLCNTCSSTRLPGRNRAPTQTADASKLARNNQRRAALYTARVLSAK
jgi:hypothetical protein